MPFLFLWATLYKNQLFLLPESVLKCAFLQFEFFIMQSPIRCQLVSPPRSEELSRGAQQTPDVTDNHPPGTHQVPWRLKRLYERRGNNSRYRIYAIWPRDGACHANHACAALTVSRSCRQAFVFFHWKCMQVLQKSLRLSIKHDMF